MAAHDAARLAVVADENPPIATAATGKRTSVGREASYVGAMEPLVAAESRGHVRAVDLVCDACALLEELRFAARTGQRGSIGVFAAFATVITTAEVVNEVQRGIAKVARDDDLAERMRQAWRSRYEPHIVVEASTYDRDDERLAALLIRDPNDVEIAALALSRPRAVLLTSDRDLLDLGFATGPWLELARRAQRVAEVDAGTAAVVFAAEHLARAACAVITAARAGSWPAQLVVAATALVTSWLLTDARRHASALDVVRSGGRTAAEALAGRERALRELRPAI